MVPRTSATSIYPSPNPLHLGRILDFNDTYNGTLVDPSMQTFNGFKAANVIYMCAALIGIIVSNACLGMLFCRLVPPTFVLKAEHWAREKSISVINIIMHLPLKAPFATVCLLR